MRVALVIRTRPQIIKSAPIILEAGRRGLGLDVVQTGQHYDYELSRVFFNELDLPDPVLNLGIGSGSHGEQAAYNG
jgi:UDP-N-acetylglucosamine 2-epimerase